MKLDFKKILRRSKTPHSNFFHSPVVLWRAMLISTFILLLSGAIFSFIIFTRVNNDDFININTDGKKVGELINKKKLEQVLQKFDDRAKATVQIMTNPILVPDPSK